MYSQGSLRTVNRNSKVGLKFQRLPEITILNEKRTCSFFRIFILLPFLCFVCLTTFHFNAPPTKRNGMKHKLSFIIYDRRFLPLLCWCFCWCVGIYEYEYMTSVKINAATLALSSTVFWSSFSHI